MSNWVNFIRLQVHRFVRDPEMSLVESMGKRWMGVHFVLLSTRGRTKTFNINSGKTVMRLFSWRHTQKASIFVIYCRFFWQVRTLFFLSSMLRACKCHFQCVTFCFVCKLSNRSCKIFPAKGKSKSFSGAGVYRSESFIIHRTVHWLPTDLNDRENDRS